MDLGSRIDGNPHISIGFGDPWISRLQMPQALSPAVCRELIRRADEEAELIADMCSPI